MTETLLDSFDFSTAEGATVAEQANKGGDFQREIAYLTLKADPASIQQGKHQAIVRLVTEYERKPWMSEGGVVTPYNFAWITVAQHYAQTKQRPPYAKENQQWPAKWNAVCRKDKVFTKAFSNSCYICDTIGSKPTDRTWALGIEREQVIENGQVVGIRDKTREVLDIGPDGKPIVEREEGEKKYYKKKTVPAWVVLNYGWKNFFNGLSGQAQWNKTVMDRDYVIQRSGTGNNDTTYAFIPLDPITVQADNPWGLPAGAKYDLSTIVGQTQDGRPVPLVEAVYPDMPDLRKIIAEKVSDDYYGRYFIPGWLPEGFDASQQGGGQQGNSGSGGIIFQQPGQAAQTQQGYQPPVQQSQPQQPQQAPAQPQPQEQQAAPSAGTLDALRNRVLGGTGQPQQ